MAEHHAIFYNPHHAVKGVREDRIKATIHTFWLFEVSCIEVQYFCYHAIKSADLFVQLYLHQVHWPRIGVEALVIDQCHRETRAAQRRSDNSAPQSIQTLLACLAHRRRKLAACAASAEFALSNHSPQETPNLLPLSSLLNRFHSWADRGEEPFPLQSNRTFLSGPQRPSTLAKPTSHQIALSRLSRYSSPIDPKHSAKRLPAGSALHSERHRTCAVQHAAHASVSIEDTRRPGSVSRSARLFSFDLETGIVLRMTKNSRNCVLCFSKHATEH